MTSSSPLDIFDRVPLRENPLTRACRAAVSAAAVVGRSPAEPAARGHFFAPLRAAPEPLCASVAAYLACAASAAPLLPAELAPAEQQQQGAADALLTVSTLLRELESIKATPLSSAPAPSRGEVVAAASAEDGANEGSAEAPVAVAARKRKILVSFNGGKDCMVILHLLASAFTADELADHFVFFVHEPAAAEEEWPEAILFRDWVMNNVLAPPESNDAGDDDAASSAAAAPATLPAGHRRTIDFRVCRGATLCDHLWQLVREFAVESVLVGTRATDPSGRWQKGCISDTTAGWPPVKLFSPVFRWSYAMVWSYTLNLDVPRCVLYDKGFTSLGAKHLTVPNEALRLTGADVAFAPAWRLVDASLERANRRPRVAPAAVAVDQQKPPQKQPQPSDIHEPTRSSI